MPLFSDKKIAIVDHTESRDGRVDNLVEYFENQGANVEVITSNFSHYTKKKITQKKDRYIYIPVITYNKNISLKRIFSHIGFARKVKKTIDNNGYDLVWALVPPNFLLKEINKCKNNFTFVADIEDLWPESLPINNKYKKNILFNTWKNIRNNNLKRVHYIVTECNLYHNYIPANLLFKTKTIYLSQKKVDLLDNIQMNRSILKLAYVGSINNIIDIELITKVTKKLLKYIKIEFVIIGDGENRDKLINSLRKIPGVIVKFYGKIFDENKKRAILKNCNFGINLMRPNVVVGLTMKSIDYLRNGLPLINNIKEDTYELVKENNIGINVTTDACDITKTIIDNSYNIQFKNKVIKIYNKNFSTNAFNQNLNLMFEDIKK